MLTRLSSLAFLCLGLLSLGGCVVYRPMQNAVPDIHAKGESEVRASSYINERLEGSLSYSPASHVLLHAAGSFSPRPDQPNDTTATWERQYNVGIGTYWNLSPEATVGIILGYGQGASWARFQVADGPRASTQFDYALHFDKVFGEAYGLFQLSRRSSMGVSCRVTQVNFTSLTNLGQPLDLSGMLRLEPALLMRLGIGGQPDALPPVQLQLAWGTSFITAPDPSAGPISRVPRYILQQRGYITFGVAVFPHRLLHHK